MIEVSLLGPPRVRRDGTLLAFDTRKAVALLAHLALTDRPRPRDSLADLLWPGTDPDRARGALRRTLSTLRSVIGADLVEATRDHVRLITGPGLSVDVVRFRALRSGHSRRDLEQAVELFDGDLLEGFAVRDAPDFEDWVRGEAEVLRREMVATLAELTGVLQSEGDSGAAVRVARRWLALDPLHEPAHRALIRLYAASGERAAALVQYRDCVRTLSRELGVPPLTETTELYEAVNRGTFPPAAPVRVPTPPDPGPDPRSPPLVGRAADLEQVRSAYHQVQVHLDGRVVLVEGEAGIGKTRLLEESLAGLQREGAHVLACQAYEDENRLAYAPVVEALRSRLRAGTDWLGAVDARALREAARLVPELVPGQVAAPGSPDDPGAETRFLAGVWETLTAAAGGPRPGVLAVDDTQWADDATLGLLAYGLRRLSRYPVLLLLSWRTPHEHGLRRAAGAAARSGAGAVVALERLDEADVRAMVRAVRPGDTDQAVARGLWETTEGVPLLLVEYLRSRDTGGVGAMPSGARDLLRARLEPVGETARQVLAAAAVLGRSFDADTVRAVSGRGAEETVVALEEVVRRGVVRERDRNYDFDHELLRALVYDDTGLARRQLLHGRAADAITSPDATVARHLRLAGRTADAARAYRGAGEQARSVFANADALDHLSTALELGHPDRVALLMAVAGLHVVLGDYTAALHSLEQAAAIAGSGDLPDVEHRLGRLRHRRGEYALAEAHLESALAAAPGSDPAARAAMTADLSLAVHAGGRPDRARGLALDARALAERAGDPGARAQAHNLLGLLATADGDPGAALVDLERGRQLTRSLGDQDLEVAVLNNLALAHRALGDLPEATDLTATALALCTARGDRHREAALHNNLADLLHAAGRPEEAMAHLKAAVEIFAEFGAVEDPRPEIWKLVRW